MPSEATIVIGSDSAVLAASDAALEMLGGLTLEQLRELPRGALSVDPDEGNSESLRAAWSEAGAPALVGSGTIRLLDGTLVRVRYLITPMADGTLELILDRSPESTDHPPRTYTVGSVLSEWRAAERKLAHIPPDSPDWVKVEAEIDYFRRAYRRVVRAKSEDSPTA